jgi:dihydroneopterin aldolase
MTLFLASVRSVAEAETALAAGADIIDLKDPARGALGAVDRTIALSCLERIGGRARVSATVGDLPMEPDPVRGAVRASAELGVDYIKLGLLPSDDTFACIDALRAEPAHSRLVFVIFADALPEFDPVATAARSGVRGVMLDTVHKDGRTLMDHLDLETLARFVASAKTNGLLVGLAGSLRAAHVPDLLALGPDLLGFRGALCAGQARDAALDGACCGAIRALIPECQTPSQPLRSPYLARQALC